MNRTLLVACVLVAGAARGFEPDGHEEILDEANRGVWDADANADLKAANAWVDWGCGGGLIVKGDCDAEWHFDDDTVTQGRPDGRTLVDDAWKRSAAANPSGQQVAVREAIERLWWDVQHEKIYRCQPTHAGCLPRRALRDHVDVVRTAFGRRSHAVHDFYSHSTFVESLGCGSTPPFTRVRSLRSGGVPGDPRWDLWIRSGWHFTENWWLKAPEHIPWWLAPVAWLVRVRNGLVYAEYFLEFTLLHGGSRIVTSVRDLPYKVGLTAPSELDFLHDGVRIRAPDGSFDAWIHGLNKDKKWSCSFPCQGGGFCGSGERGYELAKRAAIAEQREDNRRLCNTIKDVVRHDFWRPGDDTDVMAVWFYITGTELCGCRPAAPDRVYWSK